MYDRTLEEAEKQALLECLSSPQVVENNVDEEHQTLTEDTTEDSVLRRIELVNADLEVELLRQIV